MYILDNCSTGRIVPFKYNIVKNYKLLKINNQMNKT